MLLFFFADVFKPDPNFLPWEGGDEDGSDSGDEDGFDAKPDV